MIPLVNIQDIFSWVFFQSQRKNHVQLSEYERQNLKKTSVLILTSILFYQWIFSNLLDEFTGSDEYYGENCEDLLNYAEILSYFFNFFGAYEILFFASCLYESPIFNQVYVLTLGLILCYVGFFGFGIAFFVVLAEGEDCKDLGNLFVANVFVCVFFVLAMFGFILNYGEKFIEFLHELIVDHQDDSKNEDKLLRGSSQIT